MNRIAASLLAVGLLAAPVLAADTTAKTPPAAAPQVATPKADANKVASVKKPTKRARHHRHPATPVAPKTAPAPATK